MQVFGFGKMIYFYRFTWFYKQFWTILGRKWEILSTEKAVISGGLPASHKVPEHDMRLFGHGTMLMIP